MVVVVRIAFMVIVDDVINWPFYLRQVVWFKSFGLAVRVCELLWQLCFSMAAPWIFLVSIFFSCFRNPSHFSRNVQSIFSPFFPISKDLVFLMT